MIILIRTCLHFCMFDWSGKNGDESGKSQGILISCVSGNPVIYGHNCTLESGAQYPYIAQQQVRHASLYFEQGLVSYHVSVVLGPLLQRGTI